MNGIEKNKVEILIDEVSLLIEKSEFKLALPKAEEVRNLLRQDTGEESALYAKTLDNLGIVYKKLGRIVEAESLFMEALQIHKALHGEDNEDYASSLDNLGVMYIFTGKYDQAEEYLTKAMDIRGRVLGKRHRAYAISLSNMGTLYDEKADYSRSTEYFHQATDIFENFTGTDDQEYAFCLMKRSLTFYRLGNSESEDLAKKAADIQRRVLGETHLDLGLSYKMLGILRLNAGDYSAALPYLKQAKEILGNSLGVNNANYAYAMIHMGNLYLEIGNFHESKSCFKYAMKAFRKSEGLAPTHIAFSLTLLGKLYTETREYAKAESALNQAMEIYNAEPEKYQFNYAICLNKQGRLYKTLRRYSDAEDVLRKSLDILYKIVGEVKTESYYLLGLAALYRETGQYELAERELEKVFAAIGELKAYDGQAHQEALDIAFKNNAAKGRIDIALNNIQQLNAIYDKLILQINSIASERQRLGFLTSIQDAFNMYLSLVHQHLTDQPEHVYSALDLILRRKAISAEALAVQHNVVLGGKYPELKDQLDDLTSLRVQIARKTFKGPGPEGKETHEKILKEWIKFKDALEIELAKNIPELKLDEKLRKADRKAIAAALPEDSTLVEFVRFREFDFKAVPADGDSEWESPRYIAFVLPAKAPEKVRMVDLGDADKIEKLISDFRSSLIGEPGEDEIRSPDSPVKGVAGDGLALRKLVFDPLSISGNGSGRIFLAPDGNLNRLPFEVLPTDDGHQLIDDYQISYLSVGRDILRLNAGSNYRPGESLVAADPDFDLGGTPDQKEPAVTGLPYPIDLDRSNLRFSRLPGTHTEGKVISRMLSVNPIFAGDVLESKIKSVKSPLIMHIATHGFFLPDKDKESSDTYDISYENPLLRSGLALAGANTSLTGQVISEDAEDGILTAEDVTGLDLLGTELVVLSACDTGLGVIQSGEGVLGMRRAFMLAGTKTLVMSLWKVTDLVTPFLMERFYHNILERGMGRGESLREAQIYIRDMTLGEIRDKWLSEKMIEQLSGGNERVAHKIRRLAKGPDNHQPFKHPRFWGAFICQGDPGPLDSSGPPAWVKRDTPPFTWMRVTL